MAIEIAPAKKETSLKENLILILALLFLVISSGVYFYLGAVVGQKQQELRVLEAKRADLNESDINTKIEKLELAGKYISDFKVLFENNPKTSGFFNAFTKWTHPKVTYSQFTFDVPTRRASMSGTTSGFQNIMQQIATLKKAENIESYVISNVNLSEAGLVSFNLDVVLKPEVLK